jgi:hypothetical protein
MNQRSQLVRGFLIAGLCLIAGRASVAGAVPLYFEGPSGWGFSAADVLGMSIDRVVDGDDRWESAGDPSLLPSLEVTTSLIGLLGPEPMPPSFSVPLLAEVEYTVTNTTGGTLHGDLLVFTLGAVDGAPDPWPFIEPAEFGLESSGLALVHAAPYYFGAVFLPDLAPGEVHRFRVVHVVADDLGGTVVPTPGLARLVKGSSAVPEPGASLLLVSLAGFAARLRRPPAR